MGLRSFFDQGISGPLSADGKVSEETTRDARSTEKRISAAEEVKEAPKNRNANFAHPFRDEKATSFPSPLSIDVSVLTDRQNGTERLTRDNKENAAAKSGIKICNNRGNQGEKGITVGDRCDTNTCPNNEQVEICDAYGKAEGVSNGISTTKLTEVINNSIKEAMQEIVEQKFRNDRNHKEDSKSHRRSTLTKYEETGARSRKSREEEEGKKHPRTRENSRSKENSYRRQNSQTRGNLYGNSKSKEREKPAQNVKTDNRRMTGNVNIYICSEATENIQRKPEKESSQRPDIVSEATSDRSDDSSIRNGRGSSSRLINNINKRRGKPRADGSLDFVPEKTEVAGKLSEDTNCSDEVDSKSAPGFDPNKFKDVDASSEDECACESDKSPDTDSKMNEPKYSSGSSSLTVSDNRKSGKPCAPAYPSGLRLNSTESEEWMTKPVCKDAGSRDERRGGRDCPGKVLRQEESSSEFLNSVCPEFYEQDQGQSVDWNYRERGTRVCRTCTESDNDWSLVCNDSDKDESSKESSSLLDLVCGDGDCPSFIQTNRASCFGRKFSICSCIAEEQEEESSASNGDICQNCYPKVNELNSMVNSAGNSAPPANLEEAFREIGNRVQNDTRLKAERNEEALIMENDVTEMSARKGSGNDVNHREGGKNVPKHNETNQITENKNTSPSIDRNPTLTEDKTQEEIQNNPKTENSVMNSLRESGTIKPELPPKSPSVKLEEPNGSKIGHLNNPTNGQLNNSQNRRSDSSKTGQIKNSIHGQPNGSKNGQLNSSKNEPVKQLPEPQMKLETSEPLKRDSLEEEAKMPKDSKTSDEERKAERLKILEQLKMYRPTLRTPLRPQTKKAEEERKDKQPIEDSVGEETPKKEPPKTFRERVKGTFCYKGVMRMVEAIKRRRAKSPQVPEEGNVEEPTGTEDVTGKQNGEQYSGKDVAPKFDKDDASGQRLNETDIPSAKRRTIELSKENGEKKGSMKTDEVPVRETKDRIIETKDETTETEDQVTEKKDERSKKEKDERKVSGESKDERAKPKLLAVLADKQALRKIAEIQAQRITGPRSIGKVRSESVKEEMKPKVSESAAEPEEFPERSRARVSQQVSEDPETELTKIEKPAPEEIVTEVLANPEDIEKPRETMDEEKVEERMDEERVEERVYEERVEERRDADMQEKETIEVEKKEERRRTEEEKVGEPEKEVEALSTEQRGSVRENILTVCAHPGHRDYTSWEKEVKCDAGNIDNRICNCASCRCCSGSVTDPRSHLKEEDLHSAEAHRVCWDRWKNRAACNCVKPVIHRHRHSAIHGYNKPNCSKTRYQTKDNCRCRKSMFCLYCDKPRDRCVCRTPVEKCPGCEVTRDLCGCRDRETFGFRPVPGPDKDRGIRVTAWKPRREVRRYFARDHDPRADSRADRRWPVKLKPHGSDDLPYQRLSAFSNVMDELQRKISCTRCRRVPCCCDSRAKRDEATADRRANRRASSNSPRPRGKASSSPEGSRSRGSPGSRAQEAITDGRAVPIIRACRACKTTPCSCKTRKQTGKGPRAKCYYCKRSPCACIAPAEPSKSRPCRCTDSQCRRRGKVNPREKATARKNERPIVSR